MNCNPTLTEAEFKVLHNTLWELGNINDARVQTLVERIRKVALKGAYEQDNAAFERKSNHYDQVREELGLRATWSLYEETDDLSDPHPFEGATHVVYDNHWGDKSTKVSINGSTWAALYVAADAAIRDSGDGHHVFIERFTPDASIPGCLHLQTGS